MSAEEQKSLAQHKKAEKLANICEMTEFSINANEARYLREDQWSMLARIASAVTDTRVNPPSKETQKLVIDLLASREAVRTKVSKLSEAELFAPFKHD